MVPALELKDVVAGYGRIEVLHGISLRVPPGTVYALLGPNGAGKTTAIRILTTLLRADAGRALVMGHDVVHEPARVRHLIGLAGQAAAVDVNLTGRENLRLIGRLNQLPRREFVRRADELLERFGLVAAASRPVRGYSGGMRRRLDIAAALVASPPVLFFDEPTTGLDPQSRLALWEAMRELVGEGATVVLTTQYLEEADRLSGRIAVIDHGRLIADDTPAALKARLGGTVVELGVADEAAAVRAERVLLALPAGRIDRDAAAVRVVCDDGPKLLVEALHLLDAAGIAPTAVQVREPSLDDAFLALTGRRAEG